MTKSYKYDESDETGSIFFLAGVKKDVNKKLLKVACRASSSSSSASPKPQGDTDRGERPLLEELLLPPQSHRRHAGLNFDLLIIKE